MGKVIAHKVTRTEWQKRISVAMFTEGLKRENMNRKDAIALLSEFSANQFLNPNLVLLEKRELDRYRLQIRGDYNRQSIVASLRKKRLSFEMNNGYLIVFKP